MRTFLKLSTISSYKHAYLLSNYVWQRVVQWYPFEKGTVGVQFVRAVDSISADIAEGFGRFNKKDKIKFYRYAMGSQKESLDWLEKSKLRNLLNEKDYQFILAELMKLPKEINELVSFTNQKVGK